MKYLCCLSMIILNSFAGEPQSMYLWPDGAPGSEGKIGEEVLRITEKGDHVVSNIHKPSIVIYLPAQEKATGTGVVIAPGGGHRELWTDHEGHNVAKWLSERGIAAFVLKYRLAREKESTYTISGSALADTQRAIRFVRSHATQFVINPDRIGVMGFSAGGELAALAALQSENRNASAADTIDRLSSKPAFQALIYPAIPRDMQLNQDMPPAFLACGENDRLNISQGLPELYLAMKKAGMSAELHVYAATGHGFGLRTGTVAPVRTWVDRFHDWLGTLGLLKN